MPSLLQLEKILHNFSYMSLLVLASTRTSSMLLWTPPTPSIIIWVRILKISPLGDSPMGRQVYLNLPQGVINVVISLSFSANGIWWYPELKSNDENNYNFEKSLSNRTQKDAIFHVAIIFFPKNKAKQEQAVNLCGPYTC